MHRGLVAVGAALAVQGCLLTPDAFEERRTFLRDDDGDGFGGLTDCDDDNAAVHPNAEEVCDGRDNDCDGTIDDFGTDVAWYADGDGDGFGDPDSVVRSCEPPEGFVDNGDDCNDGDADTRPGATELCNDADDNCDGAIDEGAPADRLWFPDADGDGHGTPTSSYASCTAPGDSWALAGDDCDDSDPTTYPGADELCDGVDNDCDSDVDEEPTVAPPTWYLDLDGDGYGREEGAVTQCQAPSSAHVTDGDDCNDDVATVFPGAPEVCNGEDDDCDGVPDDPPTSGDGSWYVDLDSDGYGDGSSAETSCEGGPGMVDNGLDCNDGDPTVNPDGTEVCNDGEDNDCDGTPNACVWPSTLDMGDYYVVEPRCSGADMGRHGTVGDVDGDGVDELLLGAATDCGPTGDGDGGAVYVFDGPVTASTDGSGAAFEVYGEGGRLGVGGRVVLADLDSDGYLDLLLGEVGREWDDHAGVGSVEIVLGPVTASGSTDDMVDWFLAGPAYSSYQGFGIELEAVGDVDGDGTTDWASSSLYLSPLDSREGGAWLFTSTGSGTDDAEDVATAWFYGTDASENIGSSTCGADLDADGHSDWIVTSESYQASSSSTVSGAALILYGPVSGEYAPNDADLIFTAESYASAMSQHCENLGDLNADGYEDFITGSHQTGDGAAYVIWGSTSLQDMAISDADIKLRGDQTPQQFGYYTGSAGDLNEDGWTDIVVGEYGRQPNNVYVFYGPHTARGTSYSSSADIIISGNGIDDADYQAILSGHDLTGDGVPDMAIGSHFANDLDGAFYIIPGVGY